MRMPADQHIEIGIGGLPIDFWGMGYQNGEFTWRDSDRCLFNVVHSVKVCVIDADKMNALATALDRFRLIHQDSNS